MMNQLKSIYNYPFKSSHSHPIHTCLATIASNDSDVIMKKVLHPIVMAKENTYHGN